MVEKTNNINSPKQATGNELPEHLQVTTDKVRTPGWRLFDLLVHGGINGVLNIAASIWMAKDRARHVVNKAIENDETSFAKGKDISQAKTRKVWLDKVPFIGNFYEFSDWLDTQFYNKDAHGNIISEEKTKGKGFKDSYSKNQAKGGFFGRLEDTKFGQLPVVRNMLRPLGKYTGGILFLSWGGHVTNTIMWMFESPAIKPKLVRFLDNVIDGTRGIFGNKRTAEELAVRTEIYKKLDSNLSGKSIKGIWGARFAGIANVIAVASMAEAVDESINGRFDQNGNEKPLGILRASQGFFKAANYTKDRINSNRSASGKQPWNPDALSNDGTSLKAAEARYMAEQTATEILGTGITTLTQYIYLMMREFLGIGPKTNVGDKDKDGSRIAHSTATPHFEATQPAIEKQVETTKEVAAEHKSDKTEKEAKGEARKNRYTDKRKPVASHQERARTGTQETAQEQVM